MNIRRFIPSDTPHLCAIYYHCIHRVNYTDYTTQELNAWAPESCIDPVNYPKDTQRWNRIQPFVVINNHIPVGFAELESDGHINCFFVHHEYQGQGIGSLLMRACIHEAHQQGYDQIITEVSITAKSFFQYKGFNCVRPILCDIGPMKMKYYEMTYTL